MDHSLLSFLQTQDELRVLELYEANDFGPFSPEPSLLPQNFLPNLMALTSADVDAFPWTQSHFAEHLYILNNQWCSGWRMGFAHAGATLKSLSFSGFGDLPMADLAVVLLHAPELELLSLCNLPRNNVGPSVTWRRLASPHHLFDRIGPCSSVCCLTAKTS
jgi:hypothetical protein